MTNTAAPTLRPQMVGLAIFVDNCEDAAILGFSADLSEALVRIGQMVYRSTGKRGSETIGTFASHISGIFGPDFATWRDRYPVMASDVWTGL